jgi:hypothetical protein
MTDIDEAMDKALDEFSKLFRKERKKSIESHKDEKRKANPYMYYPRFFFSESDVVYWFIEKLKSELNSKRYEFHTEISIVYPTFDSKLIEKLEHGSGWRADLGIFQTGFDAGDGKDRHALYLAEFKYRIVPNTTRIGLGSAKNNLDDIRGKEVRNLKDAIQAGITEKGCMVCVDENLFEFDQNKDFTQKLETELKDRKLITRILGTTLTERKEWAGQK